MKNETDPFICLINRIRQMIAYQETLSVIHDTICLVPGSDVNESTFYLAFKGAELMENF